MLYNTEFWILIDNYWLYNAGFWKLIDNYWLCNAGFWILIDNYWLYNARFGKLINEYLLFISDNIPLFQGFQSVKLLIMIIADWHQASNPIKLIEILKPLLASFVVRHQRSE